MNDKDHLVGQLTLSTYQFLIIIYHDIDLEEFSPAPPNTVIINVDNDCIWDLVFVATLSTL